MRPSTRYKKKIFITNKLGLHARAAAKFVKITSDCKSQVSVKKGRISVNGSSILGLMALAATKGTEIQILCEGKNAKKDLNKLIELVKNNFGEEEAIEFNKKKEEIFRGIGVSHGVAIGECFLKPSEGLNFRKYQIDKNKLKIELLRFDEAVRGSISQLRKLITKSKQQVLSKNNEMIFILEAHIAMLNSSSLVKDARKQIINKFVNSESAIISELKKHENVFNKIKNNYFKERFDDVQDVCKRLLNNLKGNKKKSIAEPNEKVIFVSDNFSTADLASINKNITSGLVSAYGGPEGHFSIIARSLSIPTVVGVKNFINNVQNKEKIIIDGDKGLIIKNPNKNTIKIYERKINELKTQSHKLDQYKNILPRTLDKKKIFIEANVDNFQESKLAMENGINGIGLFRSEYLYMNRKKLPSEKEQFNLLKKTIQNLGSRKLTVRTLDIGNDKHSEQIDKIVGPSPNPALGLRAIRLTLAFPNIFKKQISAILRASAFGSLRIMLPMVSHLYELEAAKKIIKDVHKALIKKKIKVRKTLPPIGVLIETPAAALISNILAKHCDFFAIGTNDLVMYTLAIDRGDENVANIYEPSHLSVLRLIKMSKESADKNNIPVSVCGEMAGDPMFAPLLIGLGINTLSMSPSRILKMKQFVNLMRMSDAVNLSKQVFNESNYKNINRILKDFYKSLKIK